MTTALAAHEFDQSNPLHLLALFSFSPVISLALTRQNTIAGLGLSSSSTEGIINDFFLVGTSSPLFLVLFATVFPFLVSLLAPFQWMLSLKGLPHVPLSARLSLGSSLVCLTVNYAAFEDMWREIHEEEIEVLFDDPKLPHDLQDGKQEVPLIYSYATLERSLLVLCSFLFLSGSLHAASVILSPASFLPLPSLLMHLPALWAPVFP